MSITTIYDISEPHINGMVKIKPIPDSNKFHISKFSEDKIKELKPRFGFGKFSEVVCYRTYSHPKNDGTRESFSDIITRVVNGVFTIRKNFYINNGLEWDDEKWDPIALNMGVSMMKMHLLPPGRGLWMMGKEYLYKKGSSSLNNCGFCSTTEGLIKSTTWTMDSLMCGCGIGFDTMIEEKDIDIKLPGCKDCRFNDKDKRKCECDMYEYRIHDSREGWVRSLSLLLKSYIDHNRVAIHFDYSDLRKHGEKINGFGGESSGHLPLKKMHDDIRSYMECYIDSKENPYDASINLCKQQGNDWPVDEWKRQCESFDEYFKSGNLTFIESDYGEFNCSSADFICSSADFIPENIDKIKTLAKTWYTQGSPNEKIKRLKRIYQCLEVFKITRENSLLDRDYIEFGLSKKDFSKISDVELESLMNKYKKTYGISRLITDIFNSIGKCVVSGNIRRSSEIALGRPDDLEFLNLKNYFLNPERECIGWMSNNSVVLKKTEDFEYAPDIAERIKTNGEPGILNMININNFGRFGKKNPIGRESEEDHSVGINPCGEIPLESFEFCNLAEVFPTKCDTYEEMENAAKLATFYTSTVSLLQTHWGCSNKVIARNRKNGVSISGIADLHDKIGFTQITSIFKRLYKVIRMENKRLSVEAGVPESIRCTTIKPSGSISLLTGVSPGIHFPCFQYCIRRIRISSNSELVQILKNAGFEPEVDVYSGPTTFVFSFPIDNGITRTAEDVSIWKQAGLQQMLQREFADNSISVTLYFNPKSESEELEDVISQSLPVVKSLSVLPHTPAGVYAQSPYEKISKEQYEAMCLSTRPIIWSSYTEKPQMERGCDGDTCSFGEFKLAAAKRETSMDIVELSDRSAIEDSLKNKK